MKRTKISSIREEKIKGTENLTEEIRSVWGWNNANEVAESIWNSIHYNLLEGNLIFAYKSTESTSELRQIVIVQNKNADEDSFSVGMFTNGYSSLVPNVPIKYLKTEVIDDLKKYKVDKKIIETFLCILEDKIDYFNSINYVERDKEKRS